jgi:glutamate synthase (NADPH/NADH) small chain
MSIKSNRVSRRKKQPMPMQEPEVRVRNFDEVALGYTEIQAILEANRCAQCSDAPCRTGCPVGVDIPNFLYEVAEGNFKEAIAIIKEKNNLPAVCGRVCPQENQCEKYCVWNKKAEPVAIGRVERFLADYERRNGIEIPKKSKDTGNRVAVIGSGPAGLTAAAELAKMGHRVVMFEALHEPGGVLIYGIPEFRLPKKIVQEEIAYIQKLGVEIRTNIVIGKTYTLDDLILEEGFDAVFLGMGAGFPHFLGIPGENLNGVYSANEFLTRTNLMKAYQFPQYDTPIHVGKRVAVIGAGNVAMDAARTALRLGAMNVSIVYRRSIEEMPARSEEIDRAEEEGIELQLLTNPIEILGGESGWVRGLKCQRMKLGEPDETGRRVPVPVPNSEFSFPVDCVIIAIGQQPNTAFFKELGDLEINGNGTLKIIDEKGKTTKVGVWAGGDVVTGAATVIEAMGAGKEAAREIDAYLNKCERGA